MESAIGTRIRFMELQKENAELKQVLDLQLGQVEQYQEEILRENEQLEMENLELQKKLQEQEEILKKVGNNRMLLERKIDMITKGLQEAQLFFTGLESEIDNNVGVLEETPVISMLSPDLPVSSNRVTLSGSNLDLHIPVPQSAAISSGDSAWAQLPTPISDTTPVVGFQDELLASSTLETRKDPNTFPLFPLFQLPSSSSSSSSSSNSTGKPKHAIDRSRGHHPGFYCICGHRGSSKRSLIQHIQYRISKDANDFRFKCTETNCGQRCFDTYTLRNHMKSVHGLVYTGTNGCRRCGETFASLPQLWDHIRKVHRAQTAGKITVVRKSKEPVAVQHGKDMDKADANGRTRACLCGSKFSTVETLGRHLRYHSREFKFACQVCDKRVRSLFQLRHHMKVTHKLNHISTGGGSIKGCRKCGQICESIKALMRHHKKFHAAHNVANSGNQADD